MYRCALAFISLDNQHRVGTLLRKATPEGGADPKAGTWGGVTPDEMPCVRSLNIQLLARGFDGPGAGAFLRKRYEGRFAGLPQRLGAPPADGPPSWWR